MVLVDSSVWISFFKGTDQIDILENLIRKRNRAATTGIVLQEVLQGIKDQQIYEMTRERLQFLPFLDASRDTSLLAASIFRELRQKVLRFHLPMQP